MKLQIALKEARETDYWLRPLADTDLVAKEAIGKLRVTCREILRLLQSTLKTMKLNDETMQALEVKEAAEPYDCDFVPPIS